jgi:hypothetical protein
MEILYLLANIFIFSTKSYLLVNTVLLSTFMSLTFFNSKCNWDHAMPFCVWLISFIITARFNPMVTKDRILFFKAWIKSIVYVCRHIPECWLLRIMVQQIWECRHYFGLDFSFFGYNWKCVARLYHIVILILFFQGIFHIFIMVELIYIHTNTVWGFPVLHRLTNTFSLSPFSFLAIVNSGPCLF